MGIIDKNKLTYRPCVGIILFNHEGKVFVGERIDTPNAWQVPQGGIDDGEDIKVAALRELSEETGANKVKIIEISAKTTKYDLPDHAIEKFWGGKFRGQEQTWVAVRFLGNDCDINLNAHDPAEFLKWKWVNLPNIADLIVPFKRETYAQVIDMFSHIK